MRKVIYGLMVSLDGFIAGPNGELDWAIIDEELHRFVNAEESRIDTQLYGRRIYEVMAGYWPTAAENPSTPAYEVEFANSWNKMQKIVFSRTLEKVEENARLVREVNAEEIQKLKAQPGKDLELGGAELAASFIRLGLVDEYQLYVHPVILGKGISMFPPLETMVKLQLVETRIFTSGVVFLRYQPAAEDEELLSQEREPGD